MKPECVKKVTNRFRAICVGFSVLFLFSAIRFSECQEEIIIQGVPVLNTVNIIKRNKVEMTEENLEEIMLPTVSKCCDISYGYEIDTMSKCIETNHEFRPEFEDWPNYLETIKDLPVKSRYNYYLGDPCSEGKYMLDPITYPDEAYSIFSNGTLYYSGQFYEIGKFCLENVNGSVQAFMCFGSDKPVNEASFRFSLYAVGLLISIPFLVMTAVVYLGVEMLRNDYGKAVSFHAICLAIGYFVLALVQLGSDSLNNELCIAAAFFIQYFFVAAFCWLNAVCFDTWKGFNEDIHCPCTARSTGCATFSIYSMYAWYVPAIFTIISFFMDSDFVESNIPDTYLRPKFGLQSCWFQHKAAALPYFYGPVGIFLVINIIFFVLSVIKIYIIQSREAKAILKNKSTEDETRNRSLYIRVYKKTLVESVCLFFIMGINWVAELISWAVDGTHISWVITDFCNTLQGLVIFYLLVIRPKVVRNIVMSEISKFWCRSRKDCKTVVPSTNGYQLTTGREETNESVF